MRGLTRRTFTAATALARVSVLARASSFARVSVLAPLAALAPGEAGAQTWPSGTIRIVVPFPAGGSVDAIARLVQPGLQQRLGANVIVENRPGASGSTGTGMVAKSPPDGMTWLFVFDTHAVNPFLLPALPFDTEKDLDPVLLVGTAPNVICAHPSRPFLTLGDVFAAARAKPETITFGTIGSGGIGHLGMTMLSRRAGVKLVHVPYRGGGPLLNDTIAGHVDLTIASTGLLGPHLSGGRTRPLAHTGKARLAEFPKIPTVIEEGFPGFEAYSWWGVFAPSGTPKPIVDRFGADLVAALRDARVERQLVETQLIDLSLGGPDTLRKFVVEQMRMWSDVIRDNNIKGDG